MKQIFKNRNFNLILAGLTVSRLGTWIDFIGLNLYIYKVFGSGKILGIFLMARMLPSLFFGSFGGYLSDRYSRKKIMIICDILRGLLVLGFIFSKDIYSFFIIGILLSALDKIFTAANGSFIPNIVKKDDLMEANSIFRMSNSIVTILGASFGALIVSSMNFQWIFVIDSATFFISVICVSFILNYNKQEGLGGKKQSFVEDFREAYIFFRSQSSLIFLVVIRLIDSTCSGAYNTSLPIFSKSLSVDKGSAYGWIISAWTAGEFAGSLMVKQVSKKIKAGPEKIFGVSVFFMALCMGLTFHFKSIYPAMAAIFCGGFCDGISNVLFFTYLMKETPDGIRGKIIGTVTSFVFSTSALGMAAAGFFIDKYPLVFTTDFSSLFILLGVVIWYLFFSLKYFYLKKS